VNFKSKRRNRSNRRRKSRRTRTRKKKRNYSTTRKTKSNTQNTKIQVIQDVHNSWETEKKRDFVLGQGHKGYPEILAYLENEIANSQKWYLQIQNSMFQKRWCISITQIN
jgi:hypothetical protein